MVVLLSNANIVVASSNAMFALKCLMNIGMFSFWINGGQNVK